MCDLAGGIPCHQWNIYIDGLWLLYSEQKVKIMKNRIQSLNYSSYVWPYYFLCLQITRSEIRPHVYKWTVGMVAADGYLVFLHCAKKPVTTMLTYPWKCTVLHYNHLGNTWKPLVLMTRHFDYCPSASESVRSSAPVVSRCFPGGYNVKLYISRGRLAWWLLTFLHSVNKTNRTVAHI